MTADIYRYSFGPSVPFEEVEASLVLALMATESLHGQAQVRLDAAHAADKRTCVIDASTPVGRDLNCLFIGFISREFGEDSFQVERVDEHHHHHRLRAERAFSDAFSAVNQDAGRLRRAASLDAGHHAHAAVSWG